MYNHPADAVPQHIIDEQFIYSIIEDNIVYEENFSADILIEIKNFLSFSKTMVWAFPMAKMMRWRIRQNKELRYILQYKELLSVRNNIEKGSFAYDSLLFKESIFSLQKNKSHLANLVCLAILFGDEFIDGIAVEFGKEKIQHIFKDEAFNFKLQYNLASNSYRLYYAFDICDILPTDVLSKVNSKYGISYRAFYQHLLYLLNEMNRHISTLAPTTQEEVCLLICKACNKCFDTYIQDISSFNSDYTFEELRQYQKTKDDDIIQVLLTLRAVLLNKKQLKFQSQFSSWSSMVRSMQLYDDMQDIAHDYNYQMNTLAFFSKKYFPAEWGWLCKNAEQLKQKNGLALHTEVSIYMPASVMLVMQYAKNISHKKLSWVQKKIQNYLWRKNWFGINNSILNQKNFQLFSVVGLEGASVPRKFHFLKLVVQKIAHPLISNDMKKAHVIDLVLFDPQLSGYLFKAIGRKPTYFLKNCFLEYPTKIKANMYNKIMNTLHV
jgi:hypothetical protein